MTTLFGIGVSYRSNFSFISRIVMNSSTICRFWGGKTIRFTFFAQSNSMNSLPARDFQSLFTAFSLLAPATNRYRQKPHRDATEYAAQSRTRGASVPTGA